MPGISVNSKAHEIVHKMISEGERLRIHEERLPSGTTVVDAGVTTSGGYSAGLYVTEICMGGLCECQIYEEDFDGLVLPSIHVSTDHPAISTLGSQFAGWQIKVGNYFAMGSGPARALALKPKELYERIEYRDEADVAVLVLETNEKPNDDVARFIAQHCHVTPEKLYLVLTPTSSLAGSVQISGRIVETGIHKLSELGLDPKTVISGSGVAPIALPHPKSARAMGRTNDMVLYGGRAYLTVSCDDENTLSQLVAKAPSKFSRDYGRPFYDAFKSAGFDFYKIDPHLFAPATILVNNVETGNSFVAGEVNSKILRKSLGL